MGDLPIQKVIEGIKFFVTFLLALLPSDCNLEPGMLSLVVPPTALLERTRDPLQHDGIVHATGAAQTHHQTAVMHDEGIVIFLLSALQWGLLIAIRSYMMCHRLHVTTLIAPG